VSTRREQAGREELAGVEERGRYTWGFPRNLGDLLVSPSTNREGHPIKQSRPEARPAIRGIVDPGIALRVTGTAAVAASKW
jgi:hypothetical protein